MDPFRPEFEGLSIVLLGHFNPIIFQPAWLAYRKLIRDEEAKPENVNIQAITSQLLSFSSGWLTLQVLAERFQATTSDPAHFEILRDLVAGIFGVLEHTPFTTMGINRDMHFKTPSMEKWNSLGDLLAPKQVWSKFFEKPGMRSLLMQDAPKEKDGSTMVRHVRVEPSLRVNPGVYIQSNHEFTVKLAEPNDVVQQQNSAHILISILANSWREIMRDSNTEKDTLLQAV